VNNKVDKLKKDVKTLREAIRLDWLDLANLPLSAADRAGIREHINYLQSQLSEILHELDQAERSDAGLPPGHRHG
jgi:hypothetical protein